MGDGVEARTRSGPQGSEPLHHFEMPAVVGADLKVVAQTRRGDQQIEIPDHPSLPPQPSALAAKHATDLLVDAQDGDAGQEPLQLGLVRVGSSE